MKKIFLFLFWMIVLGKMVIGDATLYENTTYNPSINNVTYRMNRTFEGITVAKVNETCLTINTTIFCDASAIPIIINISGIVEVDIIPPTFINWQNNASSNTFQNGSVNFSIDMADETELNTFFFAHNQSGVMTNVTNGTMGSAISFFFNYTLNVTLEANNTICAEMSFNDTSGNINLTNQICFEVQSEVIPVAGLCRTYDFLNHSTDSTSLVSINCSGDISVNSGRIVFGQGVSIENFKPDWLRITDNLQVTGTLNVTEHIIIGSPTSIKNVTMFTNPSGNPACCAVLDDMNFVCSAGVCT